MARKKPVEISVVTFFDDKQNCKQAFMDLILQKRRETAAFACDFVDKSAKKCYNDKKVFSDVRVENEEKIA